MSNMNEEELNKPIEGEVMPEETQDHSKTLEHRTVEDVMEDNFLRYSMSVIVDRALPDVRDGMKPVHRRILFTMGEQGLRPGGRFAKSARTAPYSHQALRAHLGCPRGTHQGRDW